MSVTPPVIMCVFIQISVKRWMTAPIAYCLTFFSLYCEEIMASPALPPDFLTGIQPELCLVIKTNVQEKK